ncbi:P pilus assembly chaperone PapD [Raoultella planticola]|uniref:fimbrial biogenesis chaperone n=1 Tax=Raoultella planticola TaxID=575 RepID=UPI001033DE90|nr:molecular chaperone [Raoultella planticola]MDU4422605.1 molecular chaperone [Raoultella sp.]TDV02376.1 P pilus assembly chaperone PapD [Raoultella planticola]TDX33529.1 P pilus assembly chaperone PapD [Raoultella planticola]WPJ18649.1 molecular chaperone [Raoultella planticola]
MRCLKKSISAINTGVFVMLLCISLGHASSLKVPFVNAQRLILNDKKGSLLIRNGGDEPWLFHAWMERDGIGHLDKREDEAIISGMVFPEVARLRGNSDFRLSVTIPGEASAERESMYWLVVRFVPVKYIKENSLTLPVAYRMKVFYRPPMLTNKTPNPCALQWETDRETVRVTNRTGFHFSLSSLNFEYDALHIPAEDVLAPGSKYEFKPLADAGPLLSFSYVNDRGVIDSTGINCVSA